MPLDSMLNGQNGSSVRNNPISDRMCDFLNYGVLSLRFNGHFPVEPGLASTRMSPFWILLELRVMEVVVTIEAIRRVNLQSKCHHHQTNTQFFTGRMPFLSPNQQCQSTEGQILNYGTDIRISSNDNSLCWADAFAFKWILSHCASLGVVVSRVQVQVQ